MLSIQQFLEHKEIALVGISENQKKFGNQLYDSLLKCGYTIHPIHPLIKTYKGVCCFENINQLFDNIHAVIICVKPNNAVELIRNAIDKGIKQIWLQQGSQSNEAVKISENAGINLISSECILMFAQPMAFPHKVHRFLKQIFGKLPK